MARVNSFLNQLLEIPTADKIKDEHTITLTDHTQAPSDPPSRPQEEVPEGDAEREPSEPAKGPPATPSVEPLITKLTHTSTNLQQSVSSFRAKQKYGSYYRAPTSSNDTDRSAPPQPGDLQQQEQPTRKRTPLHPGSNQTGNTVIDILYENQRGAFLFGTPRYSSAGLLPSDPGGWQNAQFRTSPSDIRNAQVPDPSWEWVWKSWYVDMSRDVDEEGWEYSFMFKAGWNWHGNHPWFHSFVRRRRWVRMRRRKDTVKQWTGEKGHQLTAEYFTIHPRTLKSMSGSVGTRTEELARQHAKMEDETSVEKMEITDIASLMLVLRKASIAREKLLAVSKFLKRGGEELYYLSSGMEDIMQMFIFQTSRRQLLTLLESQYGSAHERRESLRHHEEGQEHDEAVRHAENLMNAVKAADEQVKRLEYWSDIKGMHEAGQTLEWEGVRWSGLGGSDEAGGEVAFASKQASHEEAHELHPFAEPEHQGPGDVGGEGGQEGVSKKSSTFFDAKTRREESSEEADRYTTAAESVGEETPKDKGKGKARALDGVAEDGEDGHTPQPEKDEQKGEEAAAAEEVEELQATVPPTDVDADDEVELIAPKPLDDPVQRDVDVDEQGLI